MSPIVISLISAAGVAAWIYNKVMIRTGNNTQNAITIAAVSAIIAFFIVLTALSAVDNYLAS